MVLLQQVVKAASQFAPQAQKYADILYATVIGTGVGISTNPTLRGSYELWKGSHRSNVKVDRKRGTIELFVEGSRETSS